MLQLLVGRRSADAKGAKQPLQITKAVDVPAKGSPSLGFWHTRLCSQPLAGVQRGTRQLKGVKGEIVLLEGQASSCWHAKLPPFVPGLTLKGQETLGEMSFCHCCLVNGVTVLSTHCSPSESGSVLLADQLISPLMHMQGRTGLFLPQIQSGTRY